jgi:hypothetical protein
LENPFTLLTTRDSYTLHCGVVTWYKLVHKNCDSKNTCEVQKFLNETFFLFSDLQILAGHRTWFRHGPFTFKKNLRKTLASSFFIHGKCKKINLDNYIQIRSLNDTPFFFLKKSSWTRERGKEKVLWKNQKTKNKNRFFGDDSTALSFFPQKVCLK